MVSVLKGLLGGERGCSGYGRVDVDRKEQLIALKRGHQEDGHLRNSDIRAREVRLIDSAGDQVGIVPLPDALDSAARAGKDLVEVAPNADPPVCRIMDYGRYRYEQASKEKAARKEQRKGGLKEMKYRPNTGVGDLETKNRKVDEFIGEGHKVKLTVRLRGRERAKPEMAKDVIDRVIDHLESDVRVENPARAEGRVVSAVIGPAAEG